MAASVKGWDKLQKKFKTLDSTLQGRILENSVVAGALLIQNAVIVKTPVVSGTLKRSIHIGGHTDMSPGFQGHDLGIKEQSDNKVVLSIGTDVEYAPYVEFGTKRQAAQPYLRPAFDNQKQSAVNEISVALKEQIDKVL